MMHESIMTLEWVWGEKKDEPPADWDGVMPYSIHEGVLYIGGMSLRCDVLNTGRRVFRAEDIEAFFDTLAG